VQVCGGVPGRAGGGGRLTGRQATAGPRGGHPPLRCGLRASAVRQADGRLLRRRDRGPDPLPLSAAVSACTWPANRRINPHLHGCGSRCDRLSAFTLKVAGSFAALRGPNHGFSTCKGEVRRGMVSRQLRTAVRPLCGDRKAPLRRFPPAASEPQRQSTPSRPGDLGRSRGNSPPARAASPEHRTEVTGPSRTSRPLRARARLTAGNAALRTADRTYPSSLATRSLRQRFALPPAGAGPGAATRTER
jgi:hypothetical protein